MRNATCVLFRQTYENLTLFTESRRDQTSHKDMLNILKLFSLPYFTLHHSILWDKAKRYKSTLIPFQSQFCF